MLFVGALACGKAPIVDEAHTPEGTSKLYLLLIRWIEAVVICSLRLHGLLAFLVLDVLLDDRERRTSHRTHEIAVCPQRRQFALQDRKLLTQKARGTAFDEPDEPMNAELRITLDQQMHMIGHHFQTQDFGLMLRTQLLNDAREPGGNLFSEHLASVLRAKDHVVFARIEHIPIGLVGDLVHRDSIQLQAIYCQEGTLPRFPSPKQGTTLLSPWLEARGFTGRFDKQCHVALALIVKSLERYDMIQIKNTNVQVRLHWKKGATTWEDSIGLTF